VRGISLKARGRQQRRQFGFRRAVGTDPHLGGVSAPLQGQAGVALGTGRDTGGGVASFAQRWIQRFGAIDRSEHRAGWTIHKAEGRLRGQ